MQSINPQNIQRYLHFNHKEKYSQELHKTHTIPQDSIHTYTTQTHTKNQHSLHYYTGLQTMLYRSEVSKSASEIL